MKLRHLNLLTVLLALLFISSCASETVDVKLQVATGDVYECTVKMDMNVNTKVMGMAMDIEQQMEVYQTLSVENITAGNVIFKNVINRFVFQQKMKGILIKEFDTDKPEKAKAMGESMGPYFSKMKNLTYSIVMDSSARIINNNVSEVYASFGLDSLMQKGGSTNIDGGNAETYMGQLAGKPIKEGDIYEVSVEATELSPVATKNIYTVQEITDEVVTLTVKTEHLSNETVEKNGISMKIKGERNGTIEIDRKTGMTLKSDIQENLDMDITAMGMKMPMKTTGTVNFICIKK